MVAHVERPELRRREGEVTFQCKRSFGFIGLDEAALHLSMMKTRPEKRRSVFFAFAFSFSSCSSFLLSCSARAVEEGERGSVGAVSRSSCERRHHEERCVP